MISNDKHHKHPKIVKAQLGHFARHEWAIYGTTCEAIEHLAQQVIPQLLPDFPTAWIDADHQHKSSEFAIAHAEQRIRFYGPSTFNSYDQKSLLHPMEVALVNGNHYPAARQIVVIDSAKEASLQRRLAQLTAIDAIVLKDTEQQIFPFVEELLADYEERPPVYQWAEMDLLVRQLREELQYDQVPVKALILAGGASQRMGQDKSQLVYYNDPHELHLAKICAEIGLETYLSKRDNTDEDLYEFPVLADRFMDLGPFGAICSAFLFDPNAAWLVIACDMPFLDQATLKYLLTHRSPGHFASTLKSAAKDFPEPLVAIYEPKAYPRLLSMLAQGVTCARKFLINSQVNILELEDDKVLSNVNTRAEFEAIKKGMNV